LSAHAASRSLAAVDPQQRRDPLHERLVDRSVAHERRRRERQPGGASANAHQPRSAFLYDVVALCAAVRGKPRMARSEGRVSGERQLGRRREDADAIVRAVI
jgi:hypothetical protein